MTLTELIKRLMLVVVFAWVMTAISAIIAGLISSTIANYLIF